MRRSRGWAATVAVAFLLLPLPATAAPAGRSGNFPDRIDLPAGFSPEGIESGRGTEVFVGSLVDGDIWRGDVRTGSGAVFIDSEQPEISVGIAYQASRDRLWVAGGGPALVGAGDVRVYDASTGALLATYDDNVTGVTVGLLNDVAITADAVYVTDSILPQLIVIPLPNDDSLPAPDMVTALPIGGDYAHVSDTINLNGIVAKNGILLVVQSSTGKLFRVNPATGIADEVDVGGTVLRNADGLELVGHRLYVVRGTNLVTVVRLGPHFGSGVVLGDITDPDLDVPSTATVTAGRLWVLNSRFRYPPLPPNSEYWISQLPLRPQRG
jgi:hypothetical protein